MEKARPSQPLSPLLFLHGALGSKTIFNPLVPLLKDHFDIYQMDFHGHGEMSSHSSESRPFQMETFVQNTLGFLQQHQLEKVSIFGYSMGGYVALLAALNDSPKINKIKNIMTLGTKFFWTPEQGTMEATKLNPQILIQKAPQFIESLKKLHGEKYWQEVIEKTSDLLGQLGESDLLPPERLQEISIPVRVCVGDRDEMAGLESSTKAFRALKKGELCVLPSTKHLFETVQLEKIAEQIKNFALT